MDNKRHEAMSKIRRKNYSDAKKADPKGVAAFEAKAQAATNSR